MSAGESGQIVFPRDERSPWSPSVIMEFFVTTEEVCEILSEQQLGSLQPLQESCEDYSTVSSTVDLQFVCDGLQMFKLLSVNSSQTLHSF